MWKLIFGIIFGLLFISSLTWGLWTGEHTTLKKVEERHEVAVVPTLPEPLPIPIIEPPRVRASEPESILPASIQYSVPFTSQAPTAQWGKQIFQDGCEEASVLMVKAWRDGEMLTKESAFKKISALGAWQQKKFGHSVDTDAADTRRFLLEEYLGVTETTLRYDFTLAELIDATQTGIVIVPTNGRKLGNPNFKIPGPLQHMLVIVGYDASLHEFITNDPGTRKGEEYRYSEAILYAAIRDYPTGKHLPITEEHKAMIVIPDAERG